MSKKRRTNRSKNALPADDQALWHRVAESITPIGKASRDLNRVRRSGVVADRTEITTDNVMETTPNEPGSDILRQPSKPRAEPLVAPHKPARAPEPKGLAHSNLRKLRSGRISIEAQLDLHGMRQSEAQSALRQFLFSAQQQGFRWVLVITGKGGRKSKYPREDDWFDGGGRGTEPGVLRRIVPIWLQDAKLRSIVIGFESAAPHHGGDGALYVNLRRRERVKKFEF